MQALALPAPEDMFLDRWQLESPHSDRDQARTWELKAFTWRAWRRQQNQAPRLAWKLFQDWRASHEAAHLFFISIWLSGNFIYFCGFTVVFNGAYLLERWISISSLKSVDYLCKFCHDFYSCGHHWILPDESSSYTSGRHFGWTTFPSSRDNLIWEKLQIRLTVFVPANDWRHCSPILSGTTIPL